MKLPRLSCKHPWHAGPSQISRRRHPCRPRRSTAPSPAGHLFPIGPFPHVRSCDTVTFGWLCDVFVDPNHRGAGVGSTLLSGTCTSGRTAGVLLQP
ncbi:GNAT family N-acetyltransferase [Frigoribacterium sp. RIT-PI-h]|uniref:GNAT family N-acetyltransferase n=1 Tax=Frigoribacterium sp. RIT-PI-h TaxID=1690245 RepID=UPI0035165CED